MCCVAGLCCTLLVNCMSVHIACLQAGLVPGTYIGMGNNGTGCFNTGTGITLGEAVTLRKL